MAASFPPQSTILILLTIPKYLNSCKKSLFSLSKILLSLPAITPSPLPYSQAPHFFHRFNHNIISYANNVLCLSMFAHILIFLFIVHTSTE